MGLTFDEAALLLDLRDVYWTRQGLLSVQLSLGITAILGSAIIGLRMLQRGEQRQEEAGAIPHRQMVIREDRRNSGGTESVAVASQAASSETLPTP